MSDSALFSEFPPVSDSDWDQQIAKDLKGGDPKKLNWKTKEGFSLTPYLRRVDSPLATKASPGVAPFRRGKSVESNHWKNLEIITSSGIESARSQAHKAVSNSVDGLIFHSHLHKTQVTGVPYGSAKDLQSLFEGWNPRSATLVWDSAQCALPTLKLLQEVFGKETQSLEGAVCLDPLSVLILCGGYTNKESYVWNEAKDTLQYAQEHFPRYKTLQVQARIFPESGANLSQELGFALAWGNEVLVRLQELGLSVSEIARQLRFHFSVGSLFFPEMAKFRSARMLWSAVLSAHGVSEITTDMVYLHATTSEWNITQYDPHVNMLRGTTSSISAILGGVDSLTTLPYQFGFGHPEDPLATRIARNTQHLIRKESYLDQVVDPAGGSYYIENLTDEISRSAWAVFQEVESQGGFSKSLQSGFIQKKVKESASQTLENLALRREVLLGTTQYPNPKDKSPEKPRPNLFSFSEENPRTLYQKESQAPSDVESPPLESWRAAQPFEVLRKKLESLSTPPQVLLLTFGSLAMRKARAGFVTNFLGVGGYPISEPPAFSDPSSAISAIESQKPAIVVFCSSDEEVLPFAKEVLPILQKSLPQTAFFVAGLPKEGQEELKALGIEDFIHVKSHLLDFLGKLGGRFFS